LTELVAENWITTADALDLVDNLMYGIPFRIVHLRAQPHPQRGIWVRQFFSQKFIKVKVMIP